MINEFNKFKEDLYVILDKKYPNDSKKADEMYNKILENMKNNFYVDYNDALNDFKEKIQNNKNDYKKN